MKFSFFTLHITHYTMASAVSTRMIPWETKNDFITTTTNMNTLYKRD